MALSGAAGIAASFLKCGYYLRDAEVVRSVGCVVQGDQRVTVLGLGNNRRRDSRRDGHFSLGY